METRSSKIEEEIDVALANLEIYEGFESTPYVCPAGYLTIGFGRNLDQHPFTVDEASEWAQDMLLELRSSLIIRLPWLASKPTAVRLVLLDMAYNLGLNGLLNFKRMLAALKEDDYALAAQELRDSRYFDQTGHRSENHYKTIMDLTYEDG